MLKRSISFFASVTFGLHLFAQLNMTLLGHLDYQQLHGSELSDIWGYVDENNNEYAIVGVDNGGVSIVDVTNPANPTEVFYTSGANSIWRDIKTWGDYAYITNESSGGLMIIDLTPLPASTNLFVTSYSGNNYPFSSAHNLYIDENGVCYIFGADYSSGGAIMLDIATDPLNPVELGIFDQTYLHDGVVRGDTLWGSAIYIGMELAVDVSNKSAPAILANWGTPNATAHNSWFSDNNDYIFTTDEVSSGFITAYDVTDLSNVTEIDRIQSNPGSGVIPHNTHFINNYVVTSYYRDGVTIVDVAHPENMIEVGNFDTSPNMSGDGFNGCWGVYPWLPSGNIIASDIENGLYVIGPTYTRGCYLTGNITEFGTGNPINNATVEIISTNIVETSDIVGNYATGTAVAGTYNVTYSKSGYQTYTETNVSLTNGNTTIVDVELVPLTPFAMNGQVVESWSSNGVANADVLMENNDFTFNLTTNGSGNFNVSAFYEGTYEVSAGKWTYVTNCIPNQYFDNNQNSVTIPLDSGIYDDFTFDNNWTIAGNANAGIWERGEPIGTTFNSVEANPEYDVSNDCSNTCYVTGNAGGNVGNDDVDGGYTILRSPVIDLSGYADPYVSYYRWFFNDGGNGNPNDSLNVKISNGSSVVTVETVTANSPDNSSWVFSSFRISDYITVTSTMRFIFEASDNQPGHLVEAGVDKFRITDLGLPPAVDFTVSDTVICKYDTVQYTDNSSGATSWNWTFQNGTPATSTDQNPTVVYNSAGFFDVTLVASNNSGSNMLYKQQYIEVDVCGGMPQSDLSGKVSVFPNPCLDETTLSYDFGSVNKEISVEISDVSGNVIQTIRPAQSPGKISLLSELPSGVYIVKITALQHTQTLRLLKL